MKTSRWQERQDALFRAMEPTQRLMVTEILHDPDVVEDVFERYREECSNDWFSPERPSNPAEWTPAQRAEGQRWVARGLLTVLSPDEEAEIYGRVVAWAVKRATVNAEDFNELSDIWEDWLTEREEAGDFPAVCAVLEEWLHRCAGCMEPTERGPRLSRQWSFESASDGMGEDLVLIRYIRCLIRWGRIEEAESLCDALESVGDAPDEILSDVAGLRADCWQKTGTSLWATEELPAESLPSRDDMPRVEDRVAEYLRGNGAVVVRAEPETWRLIVAFARNGGSFGSTGPVVSRNSVAMWHQLFFAADRSEVLESLRIRENGPQVEANWDLLLSHLRAYRPEWADYHPAVPDLLERCRGTLMEIGVDAGLPDLLCWRSPTAARPWLVEVKGPGDDVRPNQRVQLNRLKHAGVDVSVIRVVGSRRT